MLPFLRPRLPPPEAWRGFLAETYAQRQFSNSGPCVGRLEGALAEKYGGGRAAVLVPSCTTGLTLVLQALAVRGRVAIPSFTFPATAQAVLTAGCDPVLVDVDPHSYELSARFLDDALSADPSIKAVIHVRVYGFCRDLKAIEEACARRGVPLIVDSAAALGGTTLTGAPIGQAGDAEVFSLHATKVFGIGEGGLVLTPPSIAAALRRCSNFGLEDGTVVSAGLNGKMSEFAAAVGLAVLEEIDEMVARRRRVAERYGSLLERFGEDRAVSPPGRPPWQTFPIRVRSLSSVSDSEALAAAFRGHGIQVRRYYAPALHEAPYLTPFASGSLPISAELSRQMICLPVYSDMTEAEQDRVVSTVDALLPG